MAINPHKQPANHFPVLLETINSIGARNMVESSIPSVMAVIEKMRVDPVLKNWPFDSVPFYEMVLRVMKSGKPLERAAMASNLTIESAFFFPSAWNQITGSNGIEIQSAIDLIMKPMFTMLCSNFGVQFNGDMDLVAHSILTQYGGLSFVDYMICFERVKNGMYWKDTQHIMTRGINFEFMAGWLDKYSDDRESAGRAIYDQMKPDNVGSDGSVAMPLVDTVTERMAQKKASRDALKSESKRIFDEWENSMFTSTVYQQHFKTVDVVVPIMDEYGQTSFNPDGTVRTRNLKKQILCDPDDINSTRSESFTMRVPNPNAFLRMFRRVVFEFICFGDHSAMELKVAETIENIRSKYSDESDPEMFIEIELKTLMIEFKRIKKAFKGQLLVESVFKKIYPDASQNQIFRAVNETITLFADSYFDDYLPAMNEAKRPCLDYDEFLIVSALPEFVNHGFENPFTELLK